MTEKEAFNVRSLSYMDKSMRALVDMQYDLCLYKCNMKTATGMHGCKNNCFRTVIVPYRFKNHVAKDEEDNLYRKCLADKFPKIKQDDYIECTNNLYKDRFKVLGDEFVSIYEEIFTDIH